MRIEYPILWKAFMLRCFVGRIGTTHPMNMELPTALKDLLQGQNYRDTAALQRAFHPEAVVDDEREKHIGLPAISTWLHATTARYRMQVEVLDYAGSAAKDILKVRTTGDFPGSPLAMDYHVTWTGDRIRTLRIAG